MIHRRAIDLVRKALGRQAAAALIGPRQVGKTTLAVDIASAADGLYIDLESAAGRQQVQEPALFLGSHQDRLVVLDEIHRAPALFPELRGLIDQGRRAGHRNGRFLILGSASPDLLRQSGESLAGRIEYVPLGPLDVLDATPETAATTEHWVRGGLPDSLLAATGEDSLAYRQNLIRTYLERDIADLTQRRIPAETLERLWTRLAHGQGTLLNASKLAAGLGVSSPTVSGYVDLLADLLLVRRLPPYFANVKKRLVKSPKVYIRDSGLVHALLGIPDYPALAGHPVVGASWEGFVIDNLLAAAPPRTRATFYRTQAGAEIDLILELPGELAPWAIEIKLGLAPTLSRGFHHAREDVRPERCFVVYSGTERYPMAVGVEAISLGELAALLVG